VGLALLVLPPALPLFLAAMVVAGAGSALLTVAPAAVLGDVAPARSGSVVAVFQMAADVGAMTGPLLANALVDSLGYSAGFGLTALVMFIAAGLAVFMPETRDRNVPSQGQA
jgi:MFS family permease